MTLKEAYKRIGEFLDNKTETNQTRIMRDRYIFNEETVEYCKKEAEIILLLGGGSQGLKDILFDKYDFKLLFMFVKLFEDFSKLLNLSCTNEEIFMNDNVHYREATVALLDDFIKEWNSKCDCGESSVLTVIIEASLSMLDEESLSMLPCICT